MSRAWSSCCGLSSGIPFSQAGSIRNFVFGSVVSFYLFAPGHAPEQKIVRQT